MEILIPIGKSIKTGKVVFIDDVAAGLNCECICIGCHVALVAKKGEKLVHHFAHAPGQVDKDHCCPFSFERAIFLMNRLILGEAKQLSLPSYKLILQHPLTQQKASYEITTKSDLKIDDISFPKPIDKSQHSDLAIITRSGYQIAVTFILGESKIKTLCNKATPYKFNGQDIAQIEISLNDIKQMVSHQKCNYRQLLQEIVLESNINKNWIYHPNEMPYRKQLESQSALIKNKKKKTRKRTRLTGKPKASPQSTAETNRLNMESVELIASQPLQNTVANHVLLQKKQTELKQCSKQRLEQLISQVFEYKLADHNEGKRCRECYFMNSIKQKQCQFCFSEQLELITLDEDYFENIVHKYDCACYAINSAKKLPHIECNLDPN